jgi:DGQHR domain-containing protein
MMCSLEKQKKIVVLQLIKRMLMPPKLIRFSAIKVIQNKKEFYLSYVPSNVLSNVCYVARRDEDNKKGFQRVLNERRARDIAKYMDSNEGVIPSSIILSAQKEATFGFDHDKGIIYFREDKNLFLVLDGQHRLYGMFLAKKDYNIPVVIFNGLSSREEVNLFIDINTNQRGVPSTLLIDIKNLTGKETTLEEKQRELFDRLNKESVLAGYLSATKSKPGFITRLSFNSATQGIFSNPYLKNEDIDIVLNAVKNYLEAVDKVFKRSKSKARINNTTLFKAVFNIFNDIIDKSLSEHHNLKVKSIEKVLDPISKLNYDFYVGTSNAVISKVVGDMKKELNSNRIGNISLADSDVF